MPIDAFQQPPKRATAVDSVVDTFRSMIGAGSLRIGDELPTERDLARQLGVSRNTVREAIKRLEAYGVIETRQKRGASIVDNCLDAMANILSFRFGNDAGTFRDIQTFRSLIETGLAADIAERATPTDIADLRRINGELVTRQTAADRAAADLAFHVRLLTIAGNQTALRIYDVLSGVIVQIMTLGKEMRGTRLTMASHDEILAALESGDQALLQTRIQDHMAIGLQFLSEASPNTNSERQKEGGGVGK